MNKTAHTITTAAIVIELSGKGAGGRVYVCVALFCWPDIGESYGPGGFPRVDRPQRTWGARILTLHLNYVAGYTGPLLFLFERTQQLTPLTTRGKPWRLHVWAGPVFVRPHRWGVTRDRTGVCVCVLLCFINLILGNRYGCGVIPFQGTWGGRILTLHLNYVAGYTGPLLFLFERTHNYYVDN